MFRFNGLALNNLWACNDLVSWSSSYSFITPLAQGLPIENGTAYSGPEVNSG
jgi:hypothetical protein